MRSLMLDQFEAEHYRPSQGRTLIAGSRLYEGREDRRALYTPTAIGVDMLAGPGVDRVLNLEDKEAVKSLGMFDHIDCLSVLEHSKAPWKLAGNLQRMLKQGGTLYLSVPFIWRVHSYPNDYFRFTVEGARVLFENIWWRKLAYVTNKDIEPKALSRVYGDNDEDGEQVFYRCEVVGFGVRV